MFEAQYRVSQPEFSFATSGIIFLESKKSIKGGNGRPQVITPPIPQQQDNRRGMRRDPANGKKKK